MARPKPKGHCKICGGFGKLTYEHLPPESAFNGKGILLHSLTYISDASYRIANKTPRRKFPRGLGEFSLCGRCNSFTGGFYGADYLEMAQQAMAYLDVVEKSQIIYVPFRIRPLNVLKQIVSMGLTGSMAGSIGNPDLARFVLNPQLRTFPRHYDCYVYLTNKKSEARYCTESIAMNTITGAMDHLLAEVALPPLGCVITHSDSLTRSEIRTENLCSINHFTRYDLNTWMTVYLRIPVHRIWSPTPLDYRRID